MVIKTYRRNVSLLKIYKGSEFIGYYAGRDRDNNVHIKRKNTDAIVYKNSKVIEHSLVHINKYYGEEFSYVPIDCIETIKTIYYDEYDTVKYKDVKTYNVIRIKKISDMLSEPCYLINYDKKNISFDSSLNIEKALLTGEYRSNNMIYHLSLKHGAEYKFYTEKLFVKKEREIII